MFIMLTVSACFRQLPSSVLADIHPTSRPGRHEFPSDDQPEQLTMVSIAYTIHLPLVCLIPRTSRHPTPPNRNVMSQEN
jgi:hypothetical protein